MLRERLIEDINFMIINVTQIKCDIILIFVNSR